MVTRAKFPLHLQVGLIKSPINPHAIQVESANERGKRPIHTLMP